MARISGVRRRLRPPGSVGKFYLYNATKAVEFYRPVMYLYFLSLGLDFTQITILEALYNVTTVLGEVPTGYVGDRIGRRNSLALGTAFITLTLVGIGLADSFLPLAGLYVCWSLAYTFRSGSEDAWLYDKLADDLSEDDFAHVRGRASAVAQAVGVIGAVTGGYLGAIDLALPFYVAAGVTVVGVPILLAMGESETYRESESEVLGFRETLGIIRETVEAPSIRSFVVYFYVVFAGVTYLVFIFLQPVFETVVLDLGVAPAQVEPLLGWFYAGYSLLGAGISYYTGVIETYLGLRGWFLAIPFAVGFGLLGMYVLPVLALGVLLFTRAIAAPSQALAGQFVNDRVATLGRASVLSAMAMVSSLTVVPLQLGSGVVSDLASPLFALAIGGGILVVVSAAILLLANPFGAADGERTSDSPASI